jgi:cytoskeletal protein CcmA (bactofilin family)
MEALIRDGLIYERGGAVFVSIFGFLELNRNWTRSIGLSPHRTRELRLESRRPPEVAAYREQAASGPLSVIGDDVRLACDLETRGDIRIHGEVRGRVAARGCMTGDASRIDGSVTARTAQLAGYVCGPVSAGNLLLMRTACIEGSVDFETIEVRGGARYDVGRQTCAQPDDANVSRIGRFLAGLQKAA